MNIKKSSWHYRLVNFVCNGEISESLCIYFWQVVWSCFTVMIFVPIIILILLFVMVSPILNIFATEVLAVAMVGAMFDIFILCFIWIEYRKQNGIQKHPTVIGGYIRAKKEKVCPRLSFVD
ncbi:MAG: hypothetical protein ACRBCS_03025 [Cellvibrionaceae bacterium]